VDVRPWGLVQRMGVRTWQNRGSINYAVEIEGRGQKIRLPPDDIKMLGFPEGDKLTKLNHLRLLLTVYSDLATKGRFF
jgi:hypothetical protein